MDVEARLSQAVRTGRRALLPRPALAIATDEKFTTADIKTTTTKPTKYPRGAAPTEASLRNGENPYFSAINSGIVRLRPSTRNAANVHADTQPMRMSWR